MKLQELETLQTAAEVSKSPPGKDELRAKWSLEIINDILTNGLISGEMQRKKGKKPLLSCSTGRLTDRRVFGWPIIPNNREYLNENVAFGQIAGDITPLGREVISKIGDFQWRDIIPEEYDYFSYQLHKIFYRDWYSTLPVIAERPDKTALQTFMQEDKNTLKDRFASSALIAVSLEDSGTHNIFPQNYKSNYVALEGPVPNVAFQAMLIPQDIFALLKNEIIKSKVPIIPVGYTTKYVCDKACTVPDYESDIRELLNEKDCPPLFLHGVRLPANEDIDLP